MRCRWMVLVFLVLLLMLHTACQAPPREGNPAPEGFAALSTAEITTDPAWIQLTVFQRVGNENKYEQRRIITDKAALDELQRLMIMDSWEKVKRETGTFPDYRLVVDPTNGAQQSIYNEIEVWFTNGFAELYISQSHLLKKLTMQQSAELQHLIR
ncbi:hypothetical protein [Paenibacillus turpanensis]|uniref:hypothetical protein n=1 Tax=Paenibacillus turpanensis TaxID=2689078 RepID=UPI00140C0B42|nr:hypothetical protein [Paenibacillus turpanensis]